MIHVVVSLILVGVILTAMHRVQKNTLVSTYLTPLNTPKGLACDFDEKKVKDGLDYFGNKKFLE